MVDKTITASSFDRAAEHVIYELGRANWDPPAIPDLRGLPNPVSLQPHQIIDIIIMGDGFESRMDFENELADWLNQFFDQRIYEAFAGAFRIQAIYRRSAAPASAARTSYYRIPATEDGRSVSRENSWWKSSGTLNSEFRARLIEDIADLDFNGARYPSNLDVSAGGRVIHNELADMLSNCVISFLVRTEVDDGSGPMPRDASGIARRVPLAVPGAEFASTWVNIGFGENRIHEFGHAFAYLEDEYINGRGKEASRSNPKHKSIHTLSNLTFSPDLDRELWLHISPWGRFPRQGKVGRDSPVVGWVWRGGERDLGVWHAEYYCLMNGTHDNYLFTKDAAADPTANPDGTYTDENGARLRGNSAFCLWCQEIACIRILEKTGQLGSPIDPDDANAQGFLWYQRWVDRWRDRYWAFFDVDAAIAEREAYYSDQTDSAFNDLNNEGLDVWRSDLYQPFRGSAVQAVKTPASITDGELALMLEG